MTVETFTAPGTEQSQYRTRSKDWVNRDWANRDASRASRQVWIESFGLDLVEMWPSCEFPFTCHVQFPRKIYGFISQEDLFDRNTLKGLSQGDIFKLCWNDISGTVRV